jgi:hypothetical protein
LEGIILDVTFRLRPETGIHKLEIKSFVTTLLDAFLLHGGEKR